MVQVQDVGAVFRYAVSDMLMLLMMVLVMVVMMMMMMMMLLVMRMRMLVMRMRMRMMMMLLPSAVDDVVDAVAAVVAKDDDSVGILRIGISFFVRVFSPDVNEF